MKAKIIIFIIFVLITIISCLLFKNNIYLKKQLEDRNNTILKMKREHADNAIDVMKMNEEIKQYQKENEQLSKKIRNIENDCLHTCKISNELKNILFFENI